MILSMKGCPSQRGHITYKWSQWEQSMLGCHTARYIDLHISQAFQQYMTCPCIWLDQVCTCSFSLCTQSASLSSFCSLFKWLQWEQSISDGHTGRCIDLHISWGFQWYMTCLRAPGSGLLCPLGPFSSLTSYHVSRGRNCLTDLRHSPVSCVD